MTDLDLLVKPSAVQGSNLTRVLAEYAASTTADQLPAAVRERARLIIMDELACAAFGQTRTPGALATKYATSLGSHGSARIIGTSHRLAPQLAALANGTSGHADEVDGAHVVGGHPGATIVHAVTAVAEHIHATGADLLNAVVLGYEIGNRLIKACGGVFGVKSRLHLHADFLHALGAAVASSRLLGLNAEGHANAMALASFQANGLVALFKERRHISKSFCNGQYASAGVSAALMVASGLEGCEDVLGAEHGLLAAWGLDDASTVLTADLGEEYAVMGANFKFINAGYPIHSVIEAAMTLIDDQVIDIERIDAVQVGMPTNAMRVVDNRDMHNICVQDMLAAALVQGGHRLAGRPFPDLLDDPRFREVRGRIDVAPDQELDRTQPNGRGARVTLVLSDGTRASHRVEAPKGHSASEPIGWDDLAAKWRDALPAVDVDRLVRLSRSVDQVDDVEDLLQVFDPTTA